MHVEDATAEAREVEAKFEALRQAEQLRGAVHKSNLDRKVRALAEEVARAYRERMALMRDTSADAAVYERARDAMEAVFEERNVRLIRST